MSSQAFCRDHSSSMFSTMEWTVAAFAAGLTIGVGLGYLFCSWRISLEKAKLECSAQDVVCRARPDIPAEERGDAVEWQYMLTHQECRCQGLDTYTWESMAWCHSDVLEQSLAGGRVREVELRIDENKRWIVSFDKMEQLSTSSGRVRPVRRRRLCEQ